MSRDASYWRHKTLKDNTTAGSIYHRTLLRLLFPVRMQKKLLMTFGTTLVVTTWRFQNKLVIGRSLTKLIAQLKPKDISQKLKSPLETNICSAG